MARPFPSNTARPPGEISIQKISPQLFYIFFTPPKEALRSIVLDRNDFKRRILEINLELQTMRIYPFRVWSVSTMQPRYYKLEAITLDTSIREEMDIAPDDIEDILEMELPSVFIKDYNFGLGFRKEYRYIIKMLEDIGIIHLRVSNFDLTTFDKEKNEACINLRHLEMIARRMDSITEKARNVANDIKGRVVVELFADLIRHGDMVSKSGSVRAELVNLMGNNNRFMVGGATKREEREALDVIKINSEKILRDHPGQLAKLRNTIESVTLKELIKRFEGMLQGDLTESTWQKMLEENPFIINMTFGTPLVKIQNQAYIGGRKLSGSGEKITDFLYKNSSTNNASIVEIKRPGTKLLATYPYRGQLFSPSSDLVASINQVLEQIYLFEKNIATIKETNRLTDLETYSVTGVLIIGRSLLDVDHIKSFELFRGNSKNIQVITFDELLNKLKLLLQFLTADKNDDLNSLNNTQNNSEDLPF